MAKIHIIFTRDGDVFCAANSYDLAAQIALDEFQKGSLEEGYMISSCNLFEKF
jgi:hypothetical protein